MTLYKKLILILCAMIFSLLILLKTTLTLAKSNSRPVVPVEVIEPTVEIPSGEYNYTFKCVTCTEKEKKTIVQVQDLMRSFIKSKCFEDSFASFKRIEQANGFKAEGIVKKVRQSSVKDIPLIFYYPSAFQSKNTIGYTYPDSPEIYLNRIFRGYSYWNIWTELSNLFHETLHKLGFGHDFKATERRPYSVPYLGNRSVEYCEGKI